MQPLSLLFLPLMLLAFLIVTYCIGRKALRLFRLELDELEEYLIATALGTGLLIFFTLLLAITHLLYKEVYLILTVAAIAVSVRETKQLMHKLTVLFKGIRQRLKINLTGMLLLAYLFFIAAIGIATLAPVSEFDSLSYHLAFAKVYANSHSFVYQPSQTYTTMPQGMTMLYAISELFHTPNFSAMMAYSLGVLASLAIYALVRKKHSEAAALIASLLFFTAPAVIERLPQTTVDISLTYFFLTAVIVLFKYSDESDEGKKTSLVILFSVLTGTAATIKLIGLLAAATLAFGIILSWLLNRKRFNLKHLIIFGMITLALISPWLALSYHYTGNPIYPQAQTIFGGKYLDSSLTQLYAGYHKVVGLEKNPINAILVVWQITFNSKPFGPVIGLTPFFVMILPLLLIFRKEIKDMKSWGIIFAMGMAILAIQFWVHPVIRYMFPGIALISIATAMIIDAMIRHRLLKATIFLLLMASLAFNAAIWYGINAKNMHYITSGESEADYYSKLKDHNSYAAQMWINANTTQDSVVLLFNEPRGYFLDREYIISSPYQTYIDYWSMNSTGDLLTRLRDLKVSHILINDEFFDTYSLSAKGSKHVNELLGNFTKERAQIEYERNQIRVYKIALTHSPVP